ncbi:MAG: hypothetical protein LQ340_001600, partial [Diploschistes diacapsis]
MSTFAARHPPLSPQQTQTTTRPSRSTTLPSSQKSPPSPSKRASKHRHHASHSHRALHQTYPHPFSRDAHAHHSPSESTGLSSGLSLSPLSPLGELLGPVRSVAEGLGRDISGLAAQARGGLERNSERDKDKDKEKAQTGRTQSRNSWASAHKPADPSTSASTATSSAAQPHAGVGPTPAADLATARKQRQIAESALRARYNALAACTLAHHQLLASSRHTMLATIPQINATLSSLHALLHGAQSSLDALRTDIIPAATTEIQVQARALGDAIAAMETERL